MWEGVRRADAINAGDRDQEGECSGNPSEVDTGLGEPWGERGDLHPVFLWDSLCSPVPVRSASCWLLWVPSTSVLGEIRQAPWNLALDPHHFLFIMELPRMEQDRLCVTEKVVRTNQGGLQAVTSPSTWISSGGGHTHQSVPHCAEQAL